MERPQTQFVEVGNADVAYQVLGDGPPDLLLFNSPGTHVELNWEMLDYSESFRRLASFSRLIMFDRRGTGASNEAPSSATWEDLADDALAVLDAVGSRQASIVGVEESGPFAILFAAMHPDRVARLILVGSFARYFVADDYPIGMSPEAWEPFRAMIIDMWGTPDLVRQSNPSHANDADFLERAAATIRASMTPRKIAAWLDVATTIDARPALPLISAPTLVLHQRENAFTPITLGRYLADNIPGARFVEIPGGDYGLVGESGAVLPDEICEFVTGQRPVAVERRLASVLFTDIVDSTALAASLGDRRWRSLLDAHDRSVREQLQRFRGVEVKTTGDGFLASFDGPARGIRCTEAIINATKALGIEVRAGLHTGECEVRGEDIGGLAVHIAARVGALAAPGETLVSGTVKDLVVGSGIGFEERGEHVLKGVPGTWRLFAVKA